MARTTTLGAIVTALGFGCGAAVPPVPGKGGPAWIELTSEHFTMWTDADPPGARELVRQMEHLRQVIVGTAFPSTAASGRVMVLALRDDDELTAFAPTGQPRAYARGAQFPLWPPLIVLSASGARDPGDGTLAHELTHAISYGVIPHQPRWFAEGMADFFETVRLDPDRATADVGVPPERRQGVAQRKAALLPISTLFAWTSMRDHEEREYSTAWALFTFLINAHRDELLRYMQLLQRDSRARDELTMDDTKRLWNEAFPSLLPGEVDTEMRKWMLAGTHTVFHFNVQRHHWPIAERALGDADVYAARGYLYLARNVDTARAEVAAALAADPTNVLANLLGAALQNKPVTIEHSRAVVAAHPGDWRAWLLATLAINEGKGDPAELETARAKTCSLLAHNPALVAPQELCPRVTASTPQ